MHPAISIVTMFLGFCRSKTLLRIALVTGFLMDSLCALCSAPARLTAF